MLNVFIKFLFIVLWVCVIVLIILATFEITSLYTNKPKKLAKFYQIWLKDEFLSSNFLVFSGYETKHKLITHNGIKFNKNDYKYAILPFINTQYTNKDLYDLSEKAYLDMCLKLTKKVSKEENE